ncbi:MAG: carbon-nitrogen hydrolase family protein [Sphingomonadaceae bacterium]|nr:carbon-nitrogen hydrolase family protein [Sphingomonadaceae bacterium]
MEKRYGRAETVNGKKARLGALQIGSSPAGTAATLERILAYEAEIADARLDLLVLPEALLGGYPKGADFGTRIGYRMPEGRDTYLTYWEQAITLEGPEAAAVCGLAKRTATAIVTGAIERAGGTLYCVALMISDEGQLIGYHRKLMPTAAERLIWGQGDGKTLPVLPTRAGQAGAAICWENYMPQLRQAFHAKGVTIWCAPTVDEREIWHISMRHIAYEMRSFVITACQFQPAATETLGQPITLRDRAEEAPMIRGGSCIISPFGDVLAGPLYGDEGLVVAEVDTAEIVRARFDLDISGHYARGDVFASS